ncbi:MAG: amidohydrolase [Acidobacteriota bacterium]|nr:amidohydrolase [Acidobacteriota bacterium]HNQ79595.1 amidohydrolase [Candidatus Aminicenantes bacterium]MDD8028197.1 amidohydrolase [Acidobacteriota bacterium]MDD8032712.1 amidohydrolase [Acidobacteriota bacterium]MDD8038616.1 amidohydrolase [Acidobacteriota bacterium]
MSQKIRSRIAGALAVFAAGAGLVLAGAVPPEPATLVLTNGKIVTLDAAVPEAEALAARGDRIVAVGPAVEIARYIGPETEVVDLGGRLATPGWIDSHLHFMSVGASKLSLDLTTAKSWEEIVGRVEAAVQNAVPGALITGRGWHQEKWNQVPRPNVDGLPFHDALSRVSPDNPVILTHASGHSSLANAKAMELSGVTADTADPPGGRIIKDGEGRPIGAFLETAMDLVQLGTSRARAARTPAEVMTENRKIIELADRECLSKGLTSVGDAGVGWTTVELYKRIIDEGRLGIRLNVMLSENARRIEANAAAWKIEGYGAHHLSVHTIKRLIDGALGSHGAWLLEPYEDLPSSAGLNTESIEEMKETARVAVENGFQVATHAIGDRANRETLDIYEEAFRAHPGKTDLRWRIEHAQHLHPADVPRFGKLGVVAAMQAVHCPSDGPWVPKRLGAKRAGETSYVWRSLLKSGAVIANGTDAPVEAADPLPSFYAAVTRKMNNGEAFFPAQKMSREEALRSYTVNGAYAAFEEGIKGTLAAGKLADVTVFTRDLLTCPEEEILSAEVAMTIVGGKVLYKK